MDYITNYIEESARVISDLKNQSSVISSVAEICIASLRKRKKIIFCGNGGSAAEAQHFAAELMGRFLLDREPLASIALTVDTSAITAIGNDYGFNQVFARQLQGVGSKGDVLFGISTSGSSSNVISAFKMAKEIGITTVLMTGNQPVKVNTYIDFELKSSSNEANYIQEGHLVMGHLICSLIEQEIHA
jgi:D-sedoheptulose 7-phosphate isomerase